MCLLSIRLSKAIRPLDEFTFVQGNIIFFLAQPDRLSQSSANVSLTSHKCYFDAVDVAVVFIIQIVLAYQQSGLSGKVNPLDYPGAGQPLQHITFSVADFFFPLKAQRL